jgi:hypothetical protein
MWKTLLLTLSLFLGTTATRAAQWNVSVKTPSTEYELEGRIGKHPIRMHLAVADVYRCSDSRLQWMVGDEYSGWYEYIAVGKRIAIHGFYNSQGAGGASEHPPLDIYETVDGRQTGVFVTTQDAMFDGTWESFGTSPKKLRYSLEVKRMQTLHPPEPDDSICPQDASGKPSPDP